MKNKDGCLISAYQPILSQSQEYKVNTQPHFRALFNTGGVTQLNL